MTDPVERDALAAALTPMSDHTARFWEILEAESVYITVNILREHENGPPHFDSANFGDDIVKALVAEHTARPQAETRAAEIGGHLKDAAENLGMVIPCDAEGVDLLLAAMNSIIQARAALGEKP